MLSRQNFKGFLAVFITLLIIFATIAYLSTATIPREQFFQFYVLGANGQTKNYFPDSSGNLPLNTSVRWYLGTINNMLSPQMVVLKIKLGNLTALSPTDVPPTPANLPIIAEYKRILIHNETWTLPVDWKVTEIRNINSSVYLTLQFGNGTVSVGDVSATNGTFFRIILELWTLDGRSGDYMFGWRTGDVQKVAWLQLWFNVTDTNLTAT
jgi:hypothetical protein